MKSVLVFAAIVTVCSPMSTWAVTIDLVPIGNPGNAGDIQGAGIFGRVTVSYQIARLEVTNAQYVEFLSAKAASDPLELYHPFMGSNSQGGIVRTGASGSYSYSVKPSVAGAGPNGADYTYGDKPVNFVSWYDAIRFANWLNNGQGSADTEIGAYTLLGGTVTPTNGDSITRNAGATWFLPSEDEWYKAAYYNAATTSYFDYPTATNTQPNNNLPTSDTGNSANFLSGSSTTTGDPSYPFTTAGAYALSASGYGTFDQGGNVAEWNEALGTTGKRGRRGGAWDRDATYLSAATRETVTAALGYTNTGFRLAAAAAPAGVPADYSGNGVVDAADYGIWRDHLGTSFQLTNEVAGTTPGSVTEEDYTAWRARFGNTSGSGSGGTCGPSAVPESSSLLLAVMATLSLYGAHRRRV